MKLLQCLIYVVECKKILGVIKAITASVTVLVLACTAAKMFLKKDATAKKLGKALKRVMK